MNATKWLVTVGLPKDETAHFATLGQPDISHPGGHLHLVVHGETVAIFAAWAYVYAQPGGLEAGGLNHAELEKASEGTKVTDRHGITWRRYHRGPGWLRPELELTSQKLWHTHSPIFPL